MRHFLTMAIFMPYLEVPGLGELTDKQRNAFIDIIKPQHDAFAIHPMCPPNDEVDCNVATQFILMFRKAGWTVKDNVVDRLYNGTPQAGLYLVLHSTVDPDPLNPEGKTGAWTRLPQGYLQIKEAFRNIIRTSEVVGVGFPENEIGVYFGVGTAKP